MPEKTTPDFSRGRIHKLITEKHALRIKIHYSSFSSPTLSSAYIHYSLYQMAPAITQHLHRREEMPSGIVAIIIIVSAVVAVSLGAFAYYGCQQHPVRRRRYEVRLYSNSSGEFQRSRRRSDRRPDSGEVPLDVLDPDTGDVIRPAAVQLRH